MKINYKPNDTFQRVRNQLDNMVMVNRMEAFDTCMAYTRCFGQIIAQMAEDDEEFVYKIDELMQILKREGLAVRAYVKEHGYEYPRT